MILGVFITLIGISLAFIALGFFRQEHSEISLIGFLFIFLLALLILNNGLEYKTGVLRSGNFSYNVSATTPYLLNASVSEVDIYATYQDSHGFVTTKRLGFFMAVMSAVGFIGSLMGMRQLFRREL